MNFGLLVIQQAHQFIVLFDGFEGLHEDGLAAGTCSVDHALDAAFLLDLDGDDKAFAADRDQLILDGAAFGEAAEVSTQRFLYRPSLLFDFAANAGQFGRGVVFQRSVGLDLVAEKSQELGEIDDSVG